MSFTFYLKDIIKDSVLYENGAEHHVFFLRHSKIYTLTNNRRLDYISLI
jgi:hypothetical protein